MMKYVVSSSALALVLAMPAIAAAQSAPSGAGCPPGSWFCSGAQDAPPPPPNQSPSGAARSRRAAPSSAALRPGAARPGYAQPPVVVYQPPPPVMVVRPESPPPYEYARRTPIDARVASGA